MDTNLDMSELVDTPLSLALSEISNSPSDSSLESLQCTAREKISRYEPSSNEDKTVKVLHSFICHLPEQGSKVLFRYIKKNENNLAALAEHLFSTVLLPSQFTFCVISLNIVNLGMISVKVSSDESPFERSRYQNEYDNEDDNNKDDDDDAGDMLERRSIPLHNQWNN